MDNIFNAYSGFTPEQRAFEPPSGTKVIKATGEYHDDGMYRKYATLTPAPKSPTGQKAFPPTEGLADARGHVSPSSPAPEEAGALQRPKAKAKPTTKDDSIRIANASVRPPSQNPNPASSIGITDQERRWGKACQGRPLPTVSLPGRPSEPHTPIVFDGEDIVRNTIPKQSTPAHPDTTWDDM